MSDWFILGADIVFAFVVAILWVLWTFGPCWTRDKREHPPRAERVALMQRLCKEAGYDPSLPRDRK
jgi:hypothetical protein